MKSFLFSLLFMLVSVDMFTQENDLYSLMQERNEFYFSFDLNDLKDLNEISKIISIDQINENTVIAYANNKEYKAFVSKGYKTTLLIPPSMLEDHDMYDGMTRKSYDWDQYPTYDAYEAMMYEFATDYPDKCEILTLGTLNSGRKIMVARLNNGSPEGKPKFLYTSTIHGDETTGYIMMLHLIDYLLTNINLPEVQNVMNNLDIYICPDANPDGTYHGGNNTVNGATRYNAQGIDMNRNYPDAVYGPHPDGNPYTSETEWFMQLAEDYPFIMGANYHGGSEVLNYPWDNRYELHTDDAWFQYVCRQYADLAHQQNPNYMSDFNNGITNGAQWYMIGGGRQDYMNYYRQCREVTIECSHVKCPPANQLPTFWNYNYNSIMTFMTQALNGIHGIVTDSLSGQPIEAVVTVLNHDQNYSIVESHLPVGDYHRLIKGGTYTLEFTAEGYYPKQYIVTVTDNEAVVLNAQLVSTEMNIVATADHDTICLGDNVRLYATVMGGSGNYTYSWTPAEILDNPNSASPIATPEELGDLTFTVEVSDSNSTKQATVSLFVDNCQNIDEENINNIKIYPNPANSIIYLTLNQNVNNVSWSLINVQGQIIRKSSKILNSNELIINVEDMIPGFYYLNIVMDGKGIIKKVVIE